MVNTNDPRSDRSGGVLVLIHTTKACNSKEGSCLGIHRLGNFILKTVLIRKIQELYPGCEVNVIAGNSFGAEHVLNKLTSLILPQESNVFRTLLFFWKLRRMRFDAAFLAVDAAPKFLIRGCVLAGIPIRVGH